VPFVQDVWSVLFVAGAVCAFDLTEAMPQVEASRTEIRDERPQSQAVRPLAFGEREERRADALAGEIWIDVELLKPVSIEQRWNGPGCRSRLARSQVQDRDRFAVGAPARLTGSCTSPSLPDRVGCTPPGRGSDVHPNGVMRAGAKRSILR
jgi:hypothetical protein